jgi:putative flavoprotein involved in K+ transport
MNGRRESIDTLVIGGGQAGLAVGYHLSRKNIPFLIVDANQGTGDSWRNRWDSLRLFTPNMVIRLPGMSHPMPRWGFLTKDQLADFLESYAQHFELPIRHGVRVERLAREGGRFVVTVGDSQFDADNVVVAMSSWQKPRTPAFASELDPGITQLHVAEYKNPRQLRNGDVLVVGAGNSGAEVAMELSADHRVYLSGPSTGATPFRPDKLSGRILMPFVGFVVLHRVLSISTPMGRKARPKLTAKGEPLMRTKPKDLAAAGVERVPRTIGVEDGRPKLEDGRVLDVANVVWCTGFEPGFEWIDLPLFDEGRVAHERGVVPDQPGLFFVGLKYLYAPSSSTLLGVGRDAAYVVDRVVERERDPSRVAAAR